MTGTIDIMCAVPAPTLEQVRAWLTRTGWDVDTSPLGQAPQSERWNHPVHGRAWVPREELMDWLADIPNWITNRAWQIDSTPESVYRAIMGPIDHHPEEHDNCKRCFACRVRYCGAEPGMLSCAAREGSGKCDFAMATVTDTERYQLVKRRLTRWLKWRDSRGAE